MFYEPASDFFYDPKTKMYYSNKKQKYFHFIKGMDPEFQAVESQQQVDGFGAGVSGRATSIASDAAANQSITEGSEKSKIAISLKTTALSSSSATQTPASSTSLERSRLIEKLRKASSAPVPPTPAEAQVDKKHAKNMDVWTNRIKEMKGEAPDSAATQQATEPTPVKTTASGQPICILCRRKFADIEKLRRHEKLSVMHKENTAKKAASDAKKEAAVPDCTYRDRTKERQLMYAASSMDTTHVDKLLASVNPNPIAEKKPDEIRPEQALGDTNVGNQLLQKMGWKNGEALGRKQDGGNGEEPKEGRNVAESLKNDWERIESLAQAGGRY
jgi:RNA-binding protein 5/10